MKKTLMAMLVGFSVTTQALADDLYQVYQQALENDPVVNRAKAQRDAAYEGIAISRASLLPNLSGDVTYSDSYREEVDSESELIALTRRDTESFGWSVELNQSIYDHANWLGLDRAEKVAHQSDANYASSLQALIVRTTQAYLAILRAKDALEFVKAEKRAIERQLEQTKQRFEVGLTAITDVHEAQANFDNTVAQEIRAENVLELRLEELREITGKYHSDLAELNTDTFSATKPVPADVKAWLDLAEDKNLELLVQQYARDIAKEDISIASAGHLPTLGLRGSYGRADTEVELKGFTTDIPTADNASITLQLNVPIYSGHATSARTSQARYNYVAASENLEATHRQTVRSVRSSYNDVIASISTIRALQQAVVSAESALKATEAGFDVGTRTIVDVLNSTRNLFDARRNLAGARYDFIQSVVNLKRAAGTLQEQDVVDINRGLINQ
ncbi:outer membrane channel protein TolC [Aestuariibacter sp. AA17]|uniref:Outer membrane channel protein TolC n=1 Tax=Fluctibacter corallii TaxID=2984329 RepID=A0ABT3A4K4_9ALTE|nr:outer membrane channel protein TolC [Aestuariibacter sp. AA17]MCV2883601.1 outer membrane channel protein TolC [Aestuariibacter sp. AA17]